VLSARSEPGPDAARTAIDAVARTSYGRLLAYLAAGTRDLAAAEDALAEALVAAVRTWPAGIPERPEAWLLTAARRALIDVARRRDVAARALPALARLVDSAATEPDPADLPDAADSAVPDKRLELMFTCAHPAIAVGVRSPLMLQAVLGLDAARIAAAFLVAPAAMGQRLVRAKAKIKDAGIPFALPSAAQLPERLTFVLDAIYVAYGTGWDDPTGSHAGRRGLTEEAQRLARLVTELLPGEPEAHGLLATLLHTQARDAARRGPAGAFVPLDEQDVRMWSPALMAEAERHLAAAARREGVGNHDAGPYRLQAAIQSMHNRRAVTGYTDWPTVAELYDALVTQTAALGARVARASAHLHAGRAPAALEMLRALDPALTVGYQPYWVVRAHCLHRAGNVDDAGHAARVALGLTEDPAVRRHLQATFDAWEPGREEGGVAL
jgi:RNA polymerase sigma-70 factor, ECF subfamily